jgi:predicted PurR-regulated permease PerM
MSSGDERRVGELTLGEARRLAVYAAATLSALVLFALLVGKVFVALLLGVVAGAYLVPVQAWLESRLRARAGSGVVTILILIVPLVALAGFGWYELSDYTRDVFARRDEIADSISRSLERYLGVRYEETRAALQAAFSEALVRSARLFEEFREGAALFLSSATVFFFTVYYVVTQRIKLTAYVKLRVPGEFLPLYERLSTNVGGALRGALWAVFIDQSVKALIILILNLVFRVPLAVALALAAFLVGFFPLLGVWVVYIPVSIYLLVFRDSPTAAAIYLAVGVAITFGSSLVLRPLLATREAETFNFYWMLVGLVAGVYAFGIPGVVLGPAILGFAKAVMDTLAGEVKYETSLLKEERAQRDEEVKPVTGDG